MTAGQTKRFTRAIARDKVQGGEGGERRRRSRSDSVAALMSRLRRLEVVVLATTMKLRLSTAELDRLLGAMLQLHEDTDGGSESGNT